ncbi:hypothetical protein Zm00014a_034862 [Zea mays]|uniref:Uncharacterized protein n=1 Tax=Zea mays TaxID=4577 RepID=A0A3L6EEX5_MAIZE|nr:hypothetical protein Zm00014a_034862 [Zea mays]
MASGIGDPRFEAGHGREHDYFGCDSVATNRGREDGTMNVDGESAATNRRQGADYVNWDYAASADGLPWWALMALDWIMRHLRKGL